MGWEVQLHGMEITQFICGDLAGYDPSADLWTVRPSALSERYRGGACALGDRLYAIGGVDDGYLIPGVEVYRTDTNLWARQGWIANPRAFFSSVALDDAVYLLWEDHSLPVATRLNRWTLSSGFMRENDPYGRGDFRQEQTHSPKLTLYPSDKHQGMNSSGKRSPRTCAAFSTIIYMRPHLSTT